MRGAAYQANFSMGLLDEEAHGRVDLQAYVAALGDCANFIPSTLGSLRRRPGFFDLGAPVSAEAPARLIPFRRGAADQLMLEFGDQYIRFWTSDGSPVLDVGAPYEIASPWGEGDLDGLRFDQSNDVIFLTHVDHGFPVWILRRHGALDWTLVEAQWPNGPWRAENVGTTTIAASGLAGTVTLTASAALFSVGQVGERLRLRLADGQPSCASWTPATDYKAHELVQSDGKLYIAQNSDRKSGTAAPIHDQGAVSDGNLVWTYLSDGAGVVRITAVASATSATAVVERALPGWITDDNRAKVTSAASTPFVASTRWAWNAFSDRFGWPGHVALTEDDRLALSGSASEPGVYHLTRVAGYSPDKLDFTPGLGSGRVVDDDAIRKPIRGGSDPIEWLASAGVLMFGTTSRAGPIMGQTLESPLTPADNRARGVSALGASAVPPVVAHDGVAYVARGGRGVAYVRASSEQGISDDDLTLYVEDLVTDRIAGLAWAANPDRLLWAWTTAGDLLSLSWQPRQNQFGWARHPLGGGFRVESAAVLTDGEGRDGLWLIVVRSKGGADERRIWRQARRWRTGDAAQDIVYVDGARRYEGEATSTIGDLPWTGETVRVFGDGGRLVFDAVVSDDGEVTAPELEALTTATIGLRYLSRVESLPLDVGGPGATAGQLQRVLHIHVQLDDSVEAEVAFAGGPLEVEGGKPWVDLPTPIARTFKAKVGGQTGRDARWRVETDDSWPLTVRSVRATVQSDD